VTASASTSNIMSRTARAASVAESSSDHFKGYTGYYGKRLAEVMQTQGPTAAEAFAVRGVRASSPAPVIYPSKATAASASASAASASASKTSISASSTSIAQSKTTTTTERTSSAKFDAALEQQRSLEYGKQSKSRALRRAELHAVHSGKDPRHTVLPRSLGDDICKVVADLHVSPYESRELNTAKAASMQGRVKVEKMEKELSKLTENAMSYKSIYAKSARQMAMEAMQACDMEAASSKKVRKTVVSESKRVAAA